MMRLGSTPCWMSYVYARAHLSLGFYVHVIVRRLAKQPEYTIWYCFKYVHPSSKHIELNLHRLIKITEYDLYLVSKRRISSLTVSRGFGFGFVKLSIGCSCLCSVIWSIKICQKRSQNLVCVWHQDESL